MYLRIALVLFGVLSPAILYGGQSDELREGGQVLYPAAENIDFREGTLELWFTPAFDAESYHDSKKKFVRLLNIATVQGETGQGTLLYCIRGGKSILTFTTRPKTLVYPIFGEIPFLKKDVWHHVAVVWKEQTVRLFFDGKLLAERVQNEYVHRAFGPVLQKHSIRLGPARMRIDEFRISTLARSADELGYHKRLANDIHARILDAFEKWDQAASPVRTIPRILLLGKGGRVLQPAFRVDGRHGRGVDLSGWLRGTETDAPHTSPGSIGGDAPEPRRGFDCHWESIAATWREAD